MRGLGKFQPSRGIPHPTPLRGATFSHKWEKEARPAAMAFISNTIPPAAVNPA